MKTPLSYALATFCCMLILSCTKTPEACLTADKTLGEPGTIFTLISCATDAETIKWEFGDGTTATGNSVSKSYVNSGTYLVKITAESKNGKKTDKGSVAITVGNRFLKKVVITSFAAKKPDGTSNWDLGTGSATNPDVFMKFRIKDNTIFNYVTTIMTDLTNSLLPLGWDLGSARLQLTNDEWEIEMRDDDSVFGVSIGSELMASWAFNPMTKIASSPGIIVLDDVTNYRVELLYEVK
jgi:PKD repeat protein